MRPAVQKAAGPFRKERRNVYQAVIFDFDFTLGDSAKGIIQCANAALAAVGCAPAEEDAIRKTIGLSIRETYARLSGRSEPEEAEVFARVFRETADWVMTDCTELYPGTAEMLRGLHARACKVGIVTTKFHYRIEEILRKFSLTDAVDVIVGSEDVKAVKPAPDGLLMALEQMDVSREEALYVGDNAVDAQAARNADVSFAAVLTGTTDKATFQQYPHVCIAEDLSGLKL